MKLKFLTYSFFPYQILQLVFLCCFFMLLACKSQNTNQTEDKVKSTSVSHSSPEEFNKIQTIISSSCMPCHNSGTLKQVIERTQKASFKEIDGETRIRILGELEELNHYMKNGMPISFTSEEELYKFFAATPGEFYMMLDKGLMPPSWGPELMKQINWPNYKVLQSQERIKLLKFAQPYTAKYLN